MPPRPPTSTLFPYTTLFRSAAKIKYRIADQLPRPMVGNIAAAIALDELHASLRQLFMREQHIAQLGVSSRSEEHTSELQSRPHLVCRLLLEKKKKHDYNTYS